MWPTARSSVPEPEGVPAHVIFSVVRTLWLSRITAPGVGLRPCRVRSCARSTPSTRFPHALPAPHPPVVVDSAPRWEVVRQQPPGAARAQQVQHGVHQLTAVMNGRAATQLGRWDQRRQQRPLRIGQVGRVAATRRSHPYAPYTATAPVERRSIQPFQTPSSAAAACVTPGQAGKVVVRIGFINGGGWTRTTGPRSVSR